MNIVLEVPLIYTLIAVILVCIATIGFARLVSETGGWYGWLETVFGNTAVGWMLFVPGVVLLLLGNDVYALNRSNLTVAMVMGTNLGIMTYTPMILTPWVALLMFKIGSVTRTKSSDILKAIIYSILFTIIVGVIANEMWLWSVPWSTRWSEGLAANANVNAVGNQPRWPWNSMVAGRGIFTSFMAGWEVAPQMYYAIAAFIGGFILVAVLTAARARLPWLSIGIAGLITGIMIGYRLWIPAILALAIKFIVIRIGGAEAYSKKLRPLSIGAFLGFGVNGALFGVLNFFYWWAQTFG
jgi:hypothetical protein